MNSISDIIPKVASKAQQRFLTILFSTIIVMCGKVNFRNLSRYSEMSERTYRRQFSRSYNFIKGNAEIIKIAILPTSRQIIATDCSFIKKSGKGTYGIEYFYNGKCRKSWKRTRDSSYSCCWRWQQTGLCIIGAANIKPFVFSIAIYKRLAFNRQVQANRTWKKLVFAQFRWDQ